MQAKDLQAKSVKDLTKLIEDLKAELFMLRFQNSTGQLENPHKINLVRKDIARVFTVLNSKADEANKPKEKTKAPAAKAAPAPKTAEVKEKKGDK